MLVADHQLPAVPLAPPPWQLTGRGWILLVKMPESNLDDPNFMPAELQGKRRGRTAMVMAVDYTDSAVGPYQELLYIPSRFDFPNGRHYSITRIYVSTNESVVNGRINWGIPKDRCDFSYLTDADGNDDLSASLDGARFAHLRLRPRGPRLPFSSALLPRFLLTLSQFHGGRQFTYTPSARGQVQFARVVDMEFDDQLFPNLNHGKVLACVKTPRFAMTFPVSTVRPHAV